MVIFHSYVKLPEGPSYLYWTWFTIIILYRLLDWLSFFQLFCAGPTEVAVVGGSNQIRLFLHRSPQAVAHGPAEINVWELSHFLQTGPTFPVFPDVFAPESSWGFIQEPAKRFCKKKNDLVINQKKDWPFLHIKKKTVIKKQSLFAHQKETW